MCSISFDHIAALIRTTKLSTICRGKFIICPKKLKNNPLDTDSSTNNFLENFENKT